MARGKNPLAAKNRPQEFARTHKFLLLEDYLLYRLTGRYVGEPNLWASSAMLDIHTARWWPECWKRSAWTRKGCLKSCPAARRWDALRARAA